MKRKLQPVMLVVALALLTGWNANGQTISIGPNQYAFIYSVDSAHGMFFNLDDVQYELRDGLARPIWAVDANSGEYKTNIRFKAGSDLRVGPDRFAFRYHLADKFGLKFSATDAEYQFTTSDESSIFSIHANNATVEALGDVYIGPVGGAMAKLTVNADVGEDVFRARVDGNTQVIIKSTGRVGIGTSIPANLLTVDGDADFDGSVGIGTSTPASALQVTNGDVLIGEVAGTTDKLTVNAVGEAAFRVRTDGGTRLYVSASGNVGIRDGSPTQALSVNGAIDMTQSTGDKISLFGDRIGLTTMYGLGVESSTLYYKSNGQHAWLSQENAVGGTPTMLLTTAGDLGVGTSVPSDRVQIDAEGGQDALRVRVGGATKLRVNSNGGVSLGSLAAAPANGAYVSGNLHVGTTAGATGYKVAINGKLICEEIRVENSTSWPDYVFDNAYELRTIDQLKAFISEKGHLPDVPSAAEVQDKGFHLGEMDANLLRKIEELTLYVIDLQEQNRDLQNQILEVANAQK